MSDFTPFTGYISKQSSGFLRVKLSNNSEVSIPHYLKVKVTEPLNRDEFLILEGKYKNKKASIKQKEGAGSYLKKGFYIDTGSGNNVNIKLANNQIVTIPQYVSVKRANSMDSDREAFVILQGKYKNKTASIKKKGAGSSYIKQGHYIDTGFGSEMRIRLNTGQIVAVPQFINIKPEGGLSRDDFQILEGTYKGKYASIKSKQGGGSYITKNKPAFKSGATLIFKRDSEKLLVNGLGEFNAFTIFNNKIPVGTYDINIPDDPHKSSSRYSSAKLYHVWFRLGHSGDRYLHCGTRSGGCITFMDINKWDKVAEFLLLSRKDSKNVGTVKVIDE